MSEIYVESQVSKTDKPDVKFYLNNGLQVKVSEIVMSPDSCQIVSVVSDDGVEYLRDSLRVVDKFLEVPGVGFLIPGSIVRLKGQEYELNFGDHTNISNQRLISWYLTPISVETTPDPLGRPCAENRTLYVEMIKEIDLITV